MSYAKIWPMTEQAGPLQIVILGGSGDLAKRKLIPALVDLHARGRLPLDLNLIGLARTPRSDEDYRSFVTEAISVHDPSYQQSAVDAFCEKVSYLSGNFNQPESYQQLDSALNAYEEKIGSATNKIFYLAVPPQHYEEILLALSHCQSAKEEGEGWSRVLIEKPFGSNLQTAQKLDEKLSNLFKESQIFRIDHYLAKEAVQNIMSFRFANPLLRAVWNKENISAVHIRMHETIDVGSRADFYEGVGALRDVGQNHLLQLLALTAMEEPESYSAKDVRNRRAEILETLRSIPETELSERVLRGQYKGYREAAGVREESDTETYFELLLELDHDNWRGVPFYLTAGKGLDREEVSVEVTFKNEQQLFGDQSCSTQENIVRMEISPQQALSLTLNAKAPGLQFQFEPRALSFVCQEGEEEITNSYEKVLYDCIIGDHMLFTETEEVLAAWKFVSPILEIWNQLPLHTYEKGSQGPQQHLIG